MFNDFQKVKVLKSRNMHKFGSLPIFKMILPKLRLDVHLIEYSPIFYQ